MEDKVNLKGPNGVGLFHGHEEIADGKGNFKDGWRDGLWEIYWDDGTLSAKGLTRGEATLCPASSEDVIDGETVNSLSLADEDEPPSKLGM